MKESQDNFRDIDNTENDKNIKDINSEGAHRGIDDNKIREEGGQDNKKEYQVQEEEPCGQAEAAWQKAEADIIKEEAADKEESTADKEREATDQNLSEDIYEHTQRNTSSTQQYSCSYQPPYYVPNFTDGYSKKGDAKKERKGYSAGILAAVLVLAMVLSVLGGAFGYVVVKKIDRDTGSDQQDPDSSSVSGLSGTTVNTYISSGSITVNDETVEAGEVYESVASVVKAVANSVVEITTSSVVTGAYNYISEGAGSGVIIGENDTHSFIITNHHVIDGANTITVRLRGDDTAEYPAKLVNAGDADYDIAVIAIEKTGLELAKMANLSASPLTVGEEVVAIGNPLGELGGTVTNGILSATDRQVIVDGRRMTLLQTNAAINPGNSGGGLFNMAGELIGIVNAKQSDTGIEGLGFAIPIDVAYSAAKDLINYGYVTGKLDLGIGVKYTSISGYYTGIYITEVTNKELGIDLSSSYYRITEMSVGSRSYTISDIYDYYDAIDTLEEGDVLTLKLQRIVVNFYGHVQTEETQINISVSFTKAP